MCKICSQTLILISIFTIFTILTTLPRLTLLFGFFYLGYWTFSLTKKAFDIKVIFFFFFKNDIDTCYRKVVDATLFLSSTTLKTSLIVLVFLVALALVGRLLLTRYVNKEKVSRLIRVFILFFC